MSSQSSCSASKASSSVQSAELQSPLPSRSLLSLSLCSTAPEFGAIQCSEAKLPWVHREPEGEQCLLDPSMRRVTQMKWTRLIHIKTLPL